MLGPGSIVVGYVSDVRSTRVLICLDSDRHVIHEAIYG